MTYCVRIHLVDRTIQLNMDELQLNYVKKIIDLFHKDSELRTFEGLNGKTLIISPVNITAVEYFPI